MFIFLYDTTSLKVFLYNAAITQNKKIWMEFSECIGA